MSRLARVCALPLVVALAGCSPAATSDSGNHPPPPSGSDWTRFGVDEARSGVFGATTGITAAVVPTMKLQRVQLDGTVDASAIYLHGVQVGAATHDAFFVTTAYGKTLAIDANDGTILWRFTPSGIAQWQGTARITNTTPVADPDRQYIYAGSPDGKVQKLAIADGHVVWSTAITLLPTREKIASPLNYSRGHVLATTGGYVGDAPQYQGHLVILDAASGNVLASWNSLCSDHAGIIDPTSCVRSGSAIWGRAGAVVDPTTGNILVATGNGFWDGSTNWGDAMLELDPGGTRLLANYTPQNTDVLDANDIDVGSTSPVLLDATHVAQGGKDGRIRVIDLSASSGTTPHRGNEVQSVSTPSGGELTTAPAVLRRTDGVWMFAADDGGTAAWTYSAGHLTVAWTNGNPGTSPVVAGGLLYVYDSRGVLRIYDPISGQLVASLSCGSGHWNSPIIADGRIALPEGTANSHASTGVLDIWRMP